MSRDQKNGKKYFELRYKYLTNKSIKIFVGINNNL